MKKKVVLMVLLIVAVAIISVSIAACAGNKNPTLPQNGSDTSSLSASGSQATEDRASDETNSATDASDASTSSEQSNATDTNVSQTTDSTPADTQSDTDRVTDSGTFSESNTDPNTDPNTDSITDTDQSSTGIITDGSDTNTDIHTSSDNTTTNSETNTSITETTQDKTTNTTTDTTPSDTTSDRTTESTDKTNSTKTDTVTTDTDSNVSDTNDHTSSVTTPSTDTSTTDKPSTDKASTSTKTDVPSTDTATSSGTSTTDKVTDTQTETKPSTNSKTETDTDKTTDTSDIYNQEGDALGEILKPAQITLLRPVASGILVKSNSLATIDYSNTKDGYVMVKYTASTTMKLKVQVIGPSNTTYTYNIKPLEWNVFPLSDGNGDYRVLIAINTKESSYSLVLGQRITVAMDNEFAPFLRPNQYVNYENATKTMNKAAELVTGKSSLLDKVGAIYNYVTKNVSYDYEEAETVQSGYLPVLDEVLETKKGICFDYAALMTGMLRSQNVPCKLVVGYANKSYHAWISVWSADKGWINGAIFFDGSDWKLMDPTFASTGGGSSKVVYTWKYVY